jgi:DNA mismatch endonuclease (patch repair protein)
LFRLPGTRIEFWGKKIHRNRERDAEVLEELGKQGWRTGVVWECALKGKNRIGIDETVRRIISWLESGSVQQEIRGAA